MRQLRPPRDRLSLLAWLAWLLRPLGVLLRYLYSQLVKYPVVDQSNSARIVEVLRSIAELMIWGDQHNPLFFDYFAEKNIITNFAKIIAQRSADSKVKTQVIQTLSILIANTDSEQAIFYLLSNNYINDLIVARLEFGDEDLLSQYISFLKTLSFKLNARTILFFYNEKAYDFPLFVEAIKLFNHSETMVRIAVRTLTLNTYKVSDPRMQKFIVDRTCLPYFSNLVWFLKEQTLAMGRMIEDKQLMAGQQGVSKLDEVVENMIDFMLYLQDILSLNNEKMSGILTDQLLSHYVLPVLIGSLVARYDPTKMDKAKADTKPAVPPSQTGTAATGSSAQSSSSSAPSASSSSSSTTPSASNLLQPIPGKSVGLIASPPQRDYTIQARLALYMLSVVFNCFNHYGLVNSIAVALLHPSPPVICETIVRTPIKYPFRHPKLPLTGIIFPKSLRVQPAVQQADDATTEAENGVSGTGGSEEDKEGSGEGVGVSLSEVKDSNEKDTSKPADLLFSPRIDDVGKELPASGSKSDAESALDFFSAPAVAATPSSRSASPAPGLPPKPPTPLPTAPAENGVGSEHASLLDMFSGVAPSPVSAVSTEPAGIPASTAAAEPTANKPPLPPTASNASTAAASSSSSSSTTQPSATTSTTTAAAASPRTSGGALGLPSSSSSSSLPASSSASSLSNLRKNLTKSANAASEKLTNIMTNSKAIGAGLLHAPLGVVVSPEQYLYVMDTGHNKVQQFDAKTGKVVRKVGSKGEGDGQLMECEGIAVHPSTSHIYVADHNNHRVTVFDSKGAFVRSFGSEGSEAGQFNHPTGMAFSTGTGLLYICDTHNHRLCIYDSDGKYVRAVGGKRGDADGELSEPSHVAVCQSPLDSTQDRVYVTDYGNDRIQVYDQDGKFLLKFGKTGKDKGEFIAPIGLAIHAEQLYIVDRGNHRVQLFDLQGGYTRSLGRRGSGGGELNEPNGVAVGSDGKVYIADTKNDRVMVFVQERLHGSMLTDHKPFSFQPLNSNTEAHSNNNNNTNATASAATVDGASAATSSSSSNTAASSSAVSSSSALSSPSAASLSQSHSTDELRNELPPDANSKARSSLPEMKVVYNPEKSCFPEHDTRLLTDSGFLFLEDIENRIDAGQAPLYACYDKSTDSIVYRAGDIVISKPPTHWVEFTDAATRSLWNDTSDDYGSTVPANGEYANRLTLRTTPEHAMYVQLCTLSRQSYEPRVAGGADIPPHKMTAQELAPGYQCDCFTAGRPCTHGFSHYRMYMGAASGVHAPDDVISLSDRDSRSPVVSLGLHSEDELNAFLELFGYWLGNGSMQYRTTGSNCNAVHFTPHPARNRLHLRGLLARLHLVEGRHFYSNETDLQLHVFIYEPRWFRFFDNEFGCSYLRSRHYNRRLALLRQGTHNSQWRPRTPAPCNPMSITRSLRQSSASSTCDVTSDSNSPTSALTPRSRSTSVSSTDSFTNAFASAVATVPEPSCSLCDSLNYLCVDRLSGVWHCSACIAAVNDTAAETGCEREWADEEEAKPISGMSFASMQVAVKDQEPPINNDTPIQAEPVQDGVIELTQKEKQPPPAPVSLSPLDIDDDEDAGEAEDNDPVKSAKWLPKWVLFRLDTQQSRLVIEGVRHADEHSAATAAQLRSVAASGEAMQGQNVICASGVGFRDQLVHACLHAGYSAYFTLNTRAGEVRGYRAVPSDRASTIYTEAEMEAALRVDSTLQSKQVCGRHDQWCVCYADVISELLPAQDVRFDGSACRIRQEKVWSLGSVAEHGNGTVREAATMSELCEARNSGQAIRQAAAIATQPADLYDEERDGRVWCVSVDHSDALIFVQRAHRNAGGVVTKVGRTMLVGNCPNYSTLSQQNRNKQAMLFALGSQDERVGFGAMGVLLAVMSNEVMDQQLLLECGICPQKLRKQQKLLRELAKDRTAQHEQDALFGTDAEDTATSKTGKRAAETAVVDLLDTSRWADDAGQQPQRPADTQTAEVDLMSFASSSPSSPAVIRKQSDAVRAADSGSDDGDESDSEDESESSQDEETDKADDESKPELSRPDTLSTTLDFFSAQSPSSASKSNGLPSTSSSTKQAPSPAHKSTASSTFDILSSLPASPTNSKNSSSKEHTHRPFAYRPRSS